MSFASELKGANATPEFQAQESAVIPSSGETSALKSYYSSVASLENKGQLKNKSPSIIAEQHMSFAAFSSDSAMDAHIVPQDAASVTLGSLLSSW